MKHPLPKPVDSVPPELYDWLREFAQAVRDRDFEAGRALFDPDVLGFGTHRARADGLEELMREQWKVVWPATTGFAFDDRSAAIAMTDDLAIIMIHWSSVGQDDVGGELLRKGRATIGLRREDQRWSAFHTHFSISPPHPPHART